MKCFPMNVNDRCVVMRTYQMQQFVQYVLVVNHLRVAQRRRKGISTPRFDQRSTTVLTERQALKHPFFLRVGVVKMGPSMYCTMRRDTIIKTLTPAD